MLSPFRLSLIRSVLFLFFLTAAYAEVRLPAIFSDHMVLQRSVRVPVWGWASPGESVTISWNGHKSEAQADANGKWTLNVNLEKEEAGPFEMRVQGSNTIRIADVVVGEVWVASGQSNMVFSLGTDSEAAQEVLQSANPLLRQFRVERGTSDKPQEECTGRWMQATPTTTPGFTAVGYYFGKKLQKELGVPVGLISSNWGGTPAESWIGREALEATDILREGTARTSEIFQTRERFKKDFLVWLKDSGREDKATGNVASFAGENVAPEGWTAVTFPGTARTARAPETGVFWLRRKVEISPALAQRSGFPLDLGSVNAYITVYWNGTQVFQRSPQNAVISNAPIRINILKRLVKPGANTLALRLFAPTEKPEVSGKIALAGSPLEGEWLARNEYGFPPLSADIKLLPPQPPAKTIEPQMAASALFNGMIRPLIPYAIRGVIWYQGEANAGRAFQYRTTFPLLINDWRSRWSQGDFPFYFCQLANFQAKTELPGESSWAELREAQSMALRLPNTGRAVLIDVGESDDIHPRVKRPVGERLARIALVRDYGKPGEYSGPEYDSLQVEGNLARLHFTHTAGKLVAAPVPATYVVQSLVGKTEPLTRHRPESELEGFAICGADRRWVWADAKIEGDSVVVWSEQVTAPVAVRYAWANNPTCNLANGAGLPASPFRTDDFPATTAKEKY